MAELWPGGIEYSDGGAFPVTTDSILLADFVRVRPYSAVLELCCGAVLISLLLHHRAPGISVCAVELDAASAAAAERNFAANGLAGRVICGDLRDRACLPAAESCNICVCNPPYFPHGRGRVSPGAARAGARSELSCSFADVAAAASRSLRHGGKFVFEHKRSPLFLPKNDVRQKELLYYTPPAPVWQTNVQPFNGGFSFAFSAYACAHSGKSLPCPFPYGENP